MVSEHQPEIASADDKILDLSARDRYEPVISSYIDKERWGNDTTGQLKKMPLLSG